MHGNFDTDTYSFESSEMYGSPTDVWFWPKHAAMASTSPKKENNNQGNVSKRALGHWVTYLRMTVYIIVDQGKALYIPKSSFDSWMGKYFPLA